MPSATHKRARSPSRSPRPTTARGRARPPARQNSRSPSATTAVGSIPRPRPASAPVACKSACKRSAAAIRWRARADRAPACASPSPSTRAATSVLIIDDHPIVLQACRRMLEDAGVATVLEARDDLRLPPLPPPPSRRGDRRPRHAGQRTERPRRDPAHALARSALAHSRLQHAQRPDHRRARSRPAPPATCSRTPPRTN